jgi:filamentous hemagglutinin family protein
MRVNPIKINLKYYLTLIESFSMINNPLLRVNPLTLSALAIAINAASISMCFADLSANAAPVLSHASDGVVISTDNLTITQSTPSATIDWESFNVGKDSTVEFIQPNSSSVTLNNVTGARSEIFGHIKSNGQVFLRNPNGFIFGAESSVNTGSFLATTSAMSLQGDDLTLTSASDNAITIKNGATLSAKGNGYIALLSHTILNEGAISVDTQGHVILSTLDTGVITLPGVNIGIDITNLDKTHRSDSSLTLAEGSDISASKGSVILSSRDLSSVLASVVKNPTSIKAEDLYINAADIEVSSFINYSSGSVNNLHLNAKNDLTLTQNISGNNLNLNLNAENITIGTNNSNFELGSSGLKSINIATNESGKTVIFNGLKAIDFIKINSDVEYKNTSENATDLKLETNINDDNSSITLLKSFTDSSGKENTSLILESNKIYLNTVSSFSSVELDATNIYLSGDITGSNSIKATNNLHLKSDISLNAQSINLNDVKFSSSSGNIDKEFTLTLNSGLKDSKFNLQRIDNNDNIGKIDSDDYHINNIGGIILTSKYSESDNISPNNSNDILISGSLSTSKFMVGDSKDLFKLRLTDKLSINGLSNFNSQYTSINGDYEFTVVGSGVASEATVGNIGTGDEDTLSGFSMTNFNNITLNQDISTGNNGLTLSADNIWINKPNNTPTPTPPIILKNISNGKTSITGTLASIASKDSPDSDGFSSLLIDTFNGDIELGNLEALKDVSITQVSNANIRLNGDIDVTGTINLSNLGEINVAVDSGTKGEAGNITFSSNAFDSNGTHLNGYDDNITINTKSTAQLGQVSANSITIKGTNDSKSTTELNNHITAADKLNFNNTDILLKDNLTLTGYINFLSIDPSLLVEPIEPIITINGSHDLSIVSSNEKIFIHDFGEIESLNSLSIKGDAELTLNSNPKIAEGGHLSLLGDLLIKVGQDKVFDYNNIELDFSGTTINGSGALSFNTGTGDLSLGSIGDNSAIDSLTIESTGKLNLYGDINLVTPIYDFSNLNAVQIYKDMTFGSREAPATVNFGNATLDGTYGLSLFGDTLTLGEIGGKIALQDLTIHSNANLELNNDITLVGAADINADSLLLNNTITTTGLNINLATDGDLKMSTIAVLNADAGNINMSSNTGNISLGSVNALNDVNIDAAGGSIFNGIDDYVSDISTNITSENATLNGLNQIGTNVKSPIVINIKEGGTIKAESNGGIYIANLNNVNVNSRSRVFDSLSGNEAAANGANSQFNLFSSLNQTNTPTVTTNFGLISNLTWQTDEEESIKKVKTPTSVPPIYHSRNGWRLGY